MGEGAGHSPPPLPLFWQHPPESPSQSTQDAGNKATCSSAGGGLKEAETVLMPTAFAAANPAGLNSPLIQRKEDTDALTSWTLSSTGLFTHFLSRTLCGRLLLAPLKM